MTPEQLLSFKQELKALLEKYGVYIECAYSTNDEMVYVSTDMVVAKDWRDREYLVVGSSAVRASDL